MLETNTSITRVLPKSMIDNPAFGDSDDKMLIELQLANIRLFLASHALTERAWLLMACVRSLPGNTT